MNLGTNSYVLTCFHGIKNAYELIVYKLEHDVVKKYEVKKVINAYEMDLALLKIECITDITNLNFFKIPYPRAHEKLMYYITTISATPETNEMNYKLHTCTFLQMMYTKQFSFNMPLMPIVNVKLLEEIDELTGLSGCCVFNKDNLIVGIISNIQMSTKMISVVPSVSIMRFLKEVELFDDFNGLCDIVSTLKLCEITIEKNYNALIVDNCFDINYYNNTQIKLTDTLGHTLKNNDIIYEINNHQFNSDGLVSSHKQNIPLSSYIALNYMTDDIIPLKIYRKYEPKDIKLKARPVKTMRYIPVVSDKKYVEHCGLIFTEITEELLELYRNNGINISGPFLNNYIKNPYRNGNESIIIVLDINRNNIPDKILNKFDDIGLPLVQVSVEAKSNKTYNMLQLLKINKKKIINLEILKETLNNSEKNIMRFRLNYGKRIKLITTDKIESLEVIKINF